MPRSGFRLLGLRAFSGITVGVLGGAIGIHWSLGPSAAVLSAVLLVLHRRVRPVLSP